MLDRIEFLLGEALISFRRNTWMTFAAVTTAAMALFIIGGIGYAYFSLSNYAKSLESKFEIKVFARLDATADEVAELGKKLEGLEGVRDVLFETKAEAWEKFRVDNPDLNGIIVEDENPLPDTYTVTAKTIDHVPDMAKEIKTFPEIDGDRGVQFLGEEQQFLNKALSTLRWLGLLLGGLMLATGGILIYNTVRLTMISRKKEIGIMEMVGATKSTVAIPLLIEGALQGVLGGILATLVLWVAHSITQRVLNFVTAVDRTSAFPLIITILILCFAGAIYGLACSGLALKERALEEVSR